jgi:hypothetical protein
MRHVASRSIQSNDDMFISNSRRFIYVHLFKCAGTSIEKALARTLRWNDILLGSTDAGERIQSAYQQLFGLYKHSDASTIRAVIGDDLWGEYFSFATVRNPFAHAVSQYTFSMQHLEMGLRKSYMASIAGTGFMRSTDKDAWPWTYAGVKALMGLKQLQTSFGEFLRSPLLHDFTGLGSLKAQLCDPDGKLLVDQVIRMEDLAGKWPALCERLGLRDIPLARENASTSADFDYRALYRAEDINIVRARYADDFDFFGYDRELRPA